MPGTFLISTRRSNPWGENGCPRRSQQAEELSEGRIKVVQMKFPCAQGSQGFRGRKGAQRRTAHPAVLRSFSAAPAARTDRRTNRQFRARDLPSGLALMKTRTLRPAGTR